MSAEAGPAAAHPTIVVASALAARQWEIHLASPDIAAGGAVWETPPIRPYGAWLVERWLAGAPQEPAAILTPAQSAALWRRVVAESPAGEALLGHAGAAEWAAAAATLLRRWRADSAALRASARDSDFRAFLDWERRYRLTLREHGWRDGNDLETELLALPARGAGAVLATDLGESYPALTALFTHLSAAGLPIREQGAPKVHGRQRTTSLPDATEEVRAAFDWAGQRLERNPGVRIAVVVPDLEHRRDEVERLASVAMHDDREVSVWIDGGALSRDPTVGAAVSALSLLTPHAGYATFGRWLRSPFFGARAEHGIRARLDRVLREGLISHVPFSDAYRHCGLREVLRERAPLAAEALARALLEVPALTRAAPSRWAHLWTRYLAALEWLPPPRRAALLAWQNALDELARLTPILGEVSLQGALAEIGRIVERTPLVEPLPLHGIHVLHHIDAVGPGYDAVWASGFTDAAWPEPPRGNPLLPTCLQRELGLPYSTPQDAERRSSYALARLVARTPELIVSWPKRVYDYETEPSPAIAGWEPLSAGDAAALAVARAVPASREREIVADVPPRLGAERLYGGTAVLGRQARCPLRAFCQDRLGARALERLRFGLDARLRGIAAHRAAELLFGDLPSQESLLAKPSAEIADRTRQALDEVFGTTRRSLRALWQLELEQLDRHLAAFLRVEALRQPFRVRAVEQSSEVTVSGLRVRVRVDRLDELADGTLAVLDYKTGERASGGDWFTPRLRDAQVPLYASHASAAVGAAVIARLTADTAGYAGIWPEGAFPGRRSPGAADRVEDQLALWRAQVAALAQEFVGGDVRILLADYEDALGAYTPLTRIPEQLALAAGTTAAR
jgi:ATP-dependent helicase/nuclease subunit B